MAIDKTTKTDIKKTKKVEKLKTEKLENLEIKEIGNLEIEKVEIPEIIKTENDKKLEYEKYKKDNFDSLDKAITAAANAFHFMKDEELIALSLNYDIAPFSLIPEIANALKFELEKRKMRSVALELSNKLSNVEWYTKPWMKF